MLTESPQADIMAFRKVLHIPWQRVDTSVTLVLNAVIQSVSLLNVHTAVTQSAEGDVGVG